MGAIFDSENCIWGEDLRSIAYDEPFNHMDNKIVLMVDETGVSLLMPIYHNKSDVVISNLNKG